MKKIKIVILGYGDRCARYARYAFIHPEEAEIVGAIDLNPLKLSRAKEELGLGEGQIFGSIEEFLAKNISCDVVINGTMDQYHYETSVKLLDRGYNLLLEKPVTADVRELIDLRRRAEKNGCKVVVCHVLRYTPFYSSVKKIIDSGRIGKIVDMQLNEHVWYGHFVNAYVRGKWRSERECGSGLLLAKCCHDTDLMCWLNNNSVPEKVSSFGTRNFFCKENAPENSTEYCYNCPHRGTCMFDAYKMELEKDFIPFYTWAGIGKPLDEITEEDKREFLKHDVYGQCVFKTDMDLVDKQCVSVQFENGSLATLTVVGGTSKAGRHLHIICEYGEIVGYIEDNKFILREFDKVNITHKDTLIDLSVPQAEEEKDNSVAGHYGGDYYIMRDLVRFLNGEKTSVATTVIEDSVNGHLICYAAEKSRKTDRAVYLKEFAAEAGER